MLKCFVRNVTDCETNIHTGGFSNEYSYHCSSGHPRYSDRSSNRTLLLRKESSEKTGRTAGSDPGQQADSFHADHR